MGGRRGRPRKLLLAKRVGEGSRSEETLPIRGGGEIREKVKVAGVGDLGIEGGSCLSGQRIQSHWGDENKVVDSGALGDELVNYPILPTGSFSRAGETTCGRIGHLAVDCRVVVVRKKGKIYQKRAPNESTGQNLGVGEPDGKHNSRPEPRPVGDRQICNSENLEWRVVDAAKASRKGVASPLKEVSTSQRFDVLPVEEGFNRECLESLQLHGLVPSPSATCADAQDLESGEDRDQLDCGVIQEGPILDQADGRRLNRDFGAVDVWRSLNEISNDKSPGIDGFTAAFFKKSWRIIDSCCVLCHRAEETVPHLIFDCDFSKAVLLGVLNHVKLAPPRSDGRQWMIRVTRGKTNLAKVPDGCVMLAYLRMDACVTLIQMGCRGVAISFGPLCFLLCFLAASQLRFC
ncbi:hypothetical protein Dimus_015334 [Dionaea muscipula]